MPNWCWTRCAIHQARVPSLWALEASNVIARAEALGFVTEARSQAFLTLLKKLNIAIDPETTTHAPGDALQLARRYKLSSYDAAHLELALRTGLPLATPDGDLRRAATIAGIDAFTKS